MATRRKYKVQHFRDGGRVLADMPIADDEPGESGGFPAGILGELPAHSSMIAEPPPPAEPTSSVTEQLPAEDNPLQKALDAQKRAEELQRQAPQQPPPSGIEHRIAQIPNLTEHKKNFLRQFPILVEDPIVQQMFNRHYVEALQSGFKDDTSELDSHLIAATVREIEERRQSALSRDSEDAVRRLDDEVEAIQRSEAPPAPIASPPMPVAPRRSIPMSAPVSRDAPNYSGRSQSASNSMTLSAEERDIAHRSYSAPDMTDAQKEYAYAKAKRRMIQAKLDGEIQS